VAAAARLTGAILALAVAAGGCGDEPEIDVLVFSRTTSYRHTGAIDAGRAALEQRFGAELTEDPSRFSDDGLRDVALGHAAEAWSEPRYRQHVFAAIEWAAG
jgi:hypothetical protein